jgi:iron complex outermembrane receptor protein
MSLPTLLAIGAAMMTAQDPPRPDTLPRTRLTDLEVTVARRKDSLGLLPMAAAVVTRSEVTRGQPTLGLDEALTTVPGVYVANRWNFSLDQRLSIRGFGSRANFGVRGVKVLLDGVPQTLPDGQSQLTNVEYGALERIEVLRGPSSALYGNASGGALLLRSLGAGPEPVGFAARFEGGSFGASKWMVRGHGRTGPVSGTLLLSRFATDGFRQQSAADIRQFAAAVDWAISGRTRAVVRFLANDTPKAENPGALTPAEAEANPDSAAAANILRGADKRVDQQQVSIRIEHFRDNGATFSATLFGLRRDLENPLAAPPPGSPSPTAGTWNSIDRGAGGVRLEATVPLGSALRLTTGLDGQDLRDHRVNYRSVGGEPTDSVLADQHEHVTEVGPFAQVRWRAADRLAVDAGLRYDWIRFDVDDDHLTDGVDNSGNRPMNALSGNLGVAYRIHGSVTAYAQVASAFETPTTTELVNSPTGGVGFNNTLAPQRALSAEVGARGQAGALDFTVSGFIADTRDAIVPEREVGGRAYFVNAGQTRNQGVEVSVGATPFRPLNLTAAYTWADYTFTEYRPRTGAVVDTLDGNQLAGVPEHFLRIGLRAGPVAGLTADLDQILSSALYADDRNTLQVDGWGAGVTNLRLGWSGNAGSLRLAPFVSVFNLFDRRYVGSVTINGAFNRVLEPAPGRYLFAGLDIGWRSLP